MDAFGVPAAKAEIANFGERRALVMRASIAFWMLGATDGHAKNFSIFLGSGGRFRMTPLYDVLTAQPTLDGGQMPRKTSKLAMSVGKNRHDAIHDIAPRHFLQTAELAGVGISVTRAIFEDIASNAVRQAEVAIAALPDGFPEQLVMSVMAAVRHRTLLAAESLSRAR